MLPFAKSCLDGMSLTGRNAALSLLCWCCLSGSALGETVLQGDSVHGAESLVPPSRFSILILATMATLNSQCLVNCLSDAWWRIKCSQLVGSAYNYLRALTLFCQ